MKKLILTIYLLTTSLFLTAQNLPLEQYNDLLQVTLRIKQSELPISKM